MRFSKLVAHICSLTSLFFFCNKKRRKKEECVAYTCSAISGGCWGVRMGNHDLSRCGRIRITNIWFRVQSYLIYTRFWALVAITSYLFFNSLFGWVLIFIGFSRSVMMLLYRWSQEWSLFFSFTRRFFDLTTKIRICKIMLFRPSLLKSY